MSQSFTYFHGRNAVAPLKHAVEREHQLTEPHFHGRNAVAPLKPRDRSGDPYRETDFHGRNAVAPLKLHGFGIEVPSYTEISTAEMPWPH